MSPARNAYMRTCDEHGKFLKDKIRVHRSGLTCEVAECTKEATMTGYCP